VELLSDPGEQIVPEWCRAKNRARLKNERYECIWDKYEMPEYFFPRVSIDFGYRDPTGVVFWTYDYVNERMLILDELLFRGENSKTVGDLIKLKEEQVFKGAKLFGELQRDGDLRPREWEDLRVFCGINVSIVDQRDKQVTLQGLNAEIAAGHVWVSSACEQLLYQLEAGVYKTSDSDQFIRTQNLGHCDLISALSIAYRGLHRLRNRDPRPTKGMWVCDQFVPTEDDDSELKVISENTYAC
jgi:hypothetical protein